MFRFQTLEIWQLSKDYCKNCYQLARTFPDIERFALADQLRRAAISITNNIAEGSSRNDTRNFSRYLEISVGSTLETANILIFASSEGYITEKCMAEMQERAELIVRKIKAFQRSLDI